VTRPGRDAADHVLAAVVRALPADRADWGRAMRAELASIEPGRERWEFAWGCLRAAAAQGRMLRGGVHLIAVLGVVVAVFAWSATVDFPPLTWGLDVVVVVLAAACWQARRGAMLGPIGDGVAAVLLRIGGYLLAGGIVLACLAHLHPATQRAVDGGTGPLVLAVILASYLLGLATVSARRSAATARVLSTAAGCALAAAALWLATVLAAPPIPPSVGLAVALTGIAAAAAAALNSGRLGSPPRGLLAALAAGAAAAAMIVILVAVLAGYGPASLIPDITPHALTPADRIAESRIEIHDPYVAVLVLGCLLAAALSAASVATRQRSTHRLDRATAPTR